MRAREKSNSNNQHTKGQGMWRLMVLAGYFLCVAVFMVGGFIVFRTSGKYNLKKQAVSCVVGRENAVDVTVVTMGESIIQQDGWLRYKGQNYRYNDDILTFLFMVIDKESKTEVSAEYGEGRRADALFLLVLNPHEEVMKLIPINCRTMTAIDIYDGQGDYKDTITAQIGIQYGIGYDEKVSCKYQVEAVRNLFYGIPINGYLAVDMEVIPRVVALINKIDLEVIEDVRNSSVELSTDSRLARQTQFLTEFIGKIKRFMRKDFTIPVKIYDEISEQAITDINADEVAYLATVAGGYHFDARQVVAIPEKSVVGEENPDSDCEEFYIDKDGLYEMIVEIFYEPVD